MTREPGRAPPRHAHGDLTSLAPPGSQGGLNAPHHPVQQEVARETSMPLLQKSQEDPRAQFWWEQEFLREPPSPAASSNGPQLSRSPSTASQGGPWAVGDQSLPVIDLSSLECWAGGSANTWLAELLRGRQLRNPMVGKVGLGQDPMRQLPSPCSLSAAPPIRPVWANSSSPSLPGPASGQTMGQLLQSCPTLWDPMDCGPPGSSG